jgi:glycosyltransferase involved in cell wall biosynthesis
MKQVLYIRYDGLTDPLGQSQVLPYLLELSTHGFQFTILSFEKRDRYQKEQAAVNSIVADAGMDWQHLFFTARPPVLSKIYDRYRMWIKALSLYKEKRFDIIHCRSYVAAEVGFRLKKRYGAKFLFDMRGFWADEKVDNGQWDLTNPFYKKIYSHYKEKEKQFLLNADGIISLTQAAKDYLLNMDEYRQLSIEVIPCCADLEHFNYRTVPKGEADKLRHELQIPTGAKVITYLGSVGGWYMTREMFSFFRLILQKDEHYHMLLLTKDDPLKVKAEAASLAIPSNKITVTYSNRNDLPLYLSLSWCSIFFIRNTFSKIASSPTKHAELMGMGIPVVCNDIGDTGLIINKTGTGLLLNEFDDGSLKEAIEKIAEVNDFTPDRIRNCAVEYFDLKSGAKKYLQVYQKMMLQREETTKVLHG